MRKKQRTRQLYDATKDQPYFTKWRNDTMTHAKKTTKPATETPEQQEQESEAVQELISELSGEGEGSEPDDASLARMDDDGGAFAAPPSDDDSEC